MPTPFFKIQNTDNLNEHLFNRFPLSILTPFVVFLIKSGFQKLLDKTQLFYAILIRTLVRLLVKPICYSDFLGGMMKTYPTLLERWKRGDPSVVNQADFCPQTKALGPGRRAVIWVQGCALRCPGCVSPTYRPFSPATLIEAEELAARILTGPDIDGVTISGGEPAHQSIGLTLVIDTLLAQRPDLTILSYSGYTLEELRKKTDIPGIAEYLSCLDCLIDGPYVHNLDNGLTGLRGSSNQKIHHFTSRMHGFDFENITRHPEIHIQNDKLVFIGVPPQSFLSALDDAIEAVLLMKQRLVQDVRP
jgi:anaerobic ribonucleoside-triphosphate reductase activating protein